jgi:hypothetical protein
MVKQKPFSEYLNEARTKYGVPAAPRSATTSPLNLGEGRGPKQKQDPLSWFIDILSRPMRTVQNVPNQILNEELKRKQAEATGTDYNEVGGFFNVLTSPVRGFFSNNPADQPTGAQLIEKTYDVENYGRPGYIDEVNNVNEVQKAAGGFALDVALDPLTWIPGAQYVKGAQMVGRGVKGAAAAGDALVAGSGVGRVIGSDVRVAARADKAKNTRIDTARNAALDQAEELATNAPSARLPGTAFAGLVRPSARDAASQVVLKSNKERFEAPTVPVRTPDIPLGPMTQKEMKASERLVKALRAETPIPQPEVGALDAAALMDSVGPAVGSTMGEQFTATGMVPQILAQLDTLQPKTVTAVTAPDEAVIANTQRLTELRAQEERLSKLAPTSDTAEATRTARLEAVRAEIKDIERAAKKADPKRAAEVTTRFSSSAVLREIIADPVRAKELTDTLGPSVVQKLSEARNAAQLSKAVDYLGRVVRGEQAQSSSKFQNDLAEELRKQFDIKVPDTETPAISGTSAVGTERAAEAALADAADQTIRDVPWLGGYTQEQIDKVVEVLPDYLKTDFLKTAGYSYITGRGAISTSDTFGEGLHKFAKEYNQMDQYSLGEALIKDARDEIKSFNIYAKNTDPSQKIAGIQRAELLKNDYLKMLDLSFNWLDSRGVSVWMGINQNRIRLYLHQMLDTLNDTARNTSGIRYDALDIALFNTATTVPLTNIMDAVVALQRTPDISDAEVLALLKKDVGADNFLTQAQPQRWRHYLNKPPGLSEVNKDAKTGRIKGYYGLIAPNEFGNELVTLLREANPTMQKVVLHNEEMALARGMADQRNLPPDVIEDLWKMAEDPAALGDTVRAIANIPIHVGEKGASNWVMPRVSALVAKPATDYWPNDVVNDAQYIQKLVKAGMKNDREALTKQVMEQGKYAISTAEEIVKARGSMFDGVGPDGRIINEPMFYDAINEQAFNDLLAAGRTSKFSQLFQYSKGKEQIIHPYNQAHVQFSKGLADFKLNINKVSNAHSQMFTEGTTVLQQAFRDIATGKVVSPELAAAREALDPVIWSVFGKPGDPEAMGIWQRAGATLEDIQAYMNKNRLDFTIDLAAAEKKIAQGMNPVEAALEDWRLWIDEIDNPLKFLSEMYYAGSMLHLDKSAAALFVARAGVTSSKPRSGYVKIPDIDPTKHPLMSHMPKNTFIRKDILQEVNNLEEMVMSNYSPNSEFGKWFNDKYLPVLGAWKKGVTIYRLGHHVRNLVSSEGIQWTVEGSRHYTASSTDAMRVLMAHKNYDGVDWSQKLESLVQREGRLEMPKGDTRLFSFGKNDISVDELYEAADKSGLFSDYRMVEDLFEDGRGGTFEKIVNKISFKDTALERMAGGLSEYQAHYSRLHHFAQILRKEAAKGNKNWDAAVEAAAIKVRRHHPDGLTLTPFEQQVMKPLIPFYSWFRQMMPVIAEGIYQNPGRFMVYPKASYNLAVAMGVNPESLQDPFPANELFPDFVTDQLTGPVAQIDGNYFKASPGYAYADILNQFVADPTKGAIGMITPFVKVPGELITGTRWDTGVSINDYSDYMDAQLPGINYLSNFTGISTSGSLAGLLTGYGIDKQYSVDKGNKTPLDQGLSVSNWFTGLGLQNISKENYKRLAQIQERDRIAEEAEREAGTARNPF